MKSLSPLYAFVRIAIAPGVLSLVSAYANTASFVEGDQIKVRRAAPMFFRSEKYRDGNEGETFHVLAYRAELKKVFVLAKGKDGKDIALAIDADAVEIVPVDPAAALAKAQAAVDAKNFTEALAVIEHALRSNPGEASLSGALPAVKDAAAAWHEIDGSKGMVARMVAEASRLRKNAAVTDRPNPLIPQDRSNQNRAAKLREQADGLEQQSRTVLSDAEAKYASAASALKRLAVGHPLAPATGGFPGLDAAVRPGAPVAAAPDAAAAKALAELEEAKQQDLHARTLREAAAKTLAELEEDSKKPGRPPGLPMELSKFDTLENGEPGYEKTVDFINAMMGRAGKVWFSEKLKKMVLLRDSSVTVFDPAKMNPGVKLITTTFGGNSFVRPQKKFSCLIEPSDKKEPIEVTEPAKATRIVAGIYVFADDEVALEKLAKAWKHLILLCGGQLDPF